MGQDQLHKTQVAILRSLRYAPAERFSALMKSTGHTSDTFKFHLRKLIKLGYVEKLTDGRYQLTIAGKEFANNLDETKRTPRKQPMLSVFLVVSRSGAEGEPEFLMFKRARNPLIGYWTGVTDPVRWGESFEDRAAKRLETQTGLRARFKTHSLYRFRIFGSKTEELLEDILFAVMVASGIEGELQNNYPGGQHAWLTLRQLKAKDKYYESAALILDDITKGIMPSPQTQDFYYPEEDY